MSLRTQLCIQEAQLVQFSFLDLIRMDFHLIHVPVDAQISTIEEVSLRCIEEKRDTARECLFVFRERGENVDDRATIVSSNDARMNREDTDFGVL